MCAQRRFIRTGLSLSLLTAWRNLAFKIHSVKILIRLNECAGWTHIHVWYVYRKSTQPVCYVTKAYDYYTFCYFLRIWIRWFLSKEKAASISYLWILQRMHVYIHINFIPKCYSIDQSWHAHGKKSLYSDVARSNFTIFVNTYNWPWNSLTDWLWSEINLKCNGNIIYTLVKN